MKRSAKGFNLAWRRRGLSSRRHHPRATGKPPQSERAVAAGSRAAPKIFV